MTTVLLETRGLKAFYGPVQVLHGLDLSVEEGGVTALLGANGAGKTTILRALCAMVRREGAITYAGAPMKALKSVANAIKRRMLSAPRPWEAPQ